MRIRHFSEAKEKLLSLLDDYVGEAGGTFECALLVIDLFGRFHVLFFGKSSGTEEFEISAKALVGDFLESVQVLSTRVEMNEYNDVRRDAGVAKRSGGKVLVLDRHRSKSSWFEGAVGTVKKPRKTKVVSFYSFKGGVGRTTCLAACAMLLAKEGARVAIVDADLDAPGLSPLLANRNDAISEYGVVDYMLDSYSVERPDLADYSFKIRDELLVGSGEIQIFPSGDVNDEYVQKLSRVDYESGRGQHEESPLRTLIQRIEDEVLPDYLFIDTRSGIGESSGIALGAVSDCVVLLSMHSRQSWAGLHVAIRRLGADRIMKGKPQIPCVLVQTLIPRDNREVSTKITNEFVEMAADVFSDNYYSVDPESDENELVDTWYLRDMQDGDAPHKSMPIRYEPVLAGFKNIVDVLDVFQSTEYVDISGLILRRLGKRG